MARISDKRIREAHLSESVECPHCHTVLVFTLPEGPDADQVRLLIAPFLMARSFKLEDIEEAETRAREFRDRGLLQDLG